MKIGKLLKSRKGIALEMAIFMLVVVFALCTLVLTTSFILRVNEKNHQKKVEEGVLLDNIGEDFCNTIKNGQVYEISESKTIGGYSLTEVYAEVTPDNKTQHILVIRRLYGNEILLKVIVEEDGDEYRTILWQKGNFELQ